MRIRHLLALLAAGAAVAVGGMLFVTRGLDEVFVMVAAIAALAVLYLLRSYSRASLLADSPSAPVPVQPHTADREEAGAHSLTGGHGPR
jgi:hypothetical protein